MSDDLNTELRFGADTTGAEAGVNRVKRSLKDLGDSANKASKDAGDSLGRVGAGGDKAAKDVDRATKTMQSSLQRVIASFEGGEKGSRQFYESLARQRNVDVNTLKPLLDQLDAVKAKSEAASQASAKVGTSFTGLGAAAGLAARAVAAIGIGASVGEFVKMADASTNVASRLGLVTSSAAELASVQARLFGIAQSSRVSFVDLVGTYAQVARSTKDLGVSQTALLGVIQTISQAVTISGGSAASAQAALTQLSQGFASGALRGEELNSVLEQTPRLAQALAYGLGVGIGQLREMGKAGELTSEKVLGALEKSAASVAAEFGKMAVTVEQASTNAANSALKLVGVLDKITGASSATAGGISRLSAGMDGLAINIERLSGSKGLSDFFFLAFNNERSLNGELEITQKELAGLEARLAKAPSNIYTRSAVAEMREYVKELKEAQARLAALSGQSGPTDPRDQSGFTGRGASYANEAARQAKLRDDANAFRLNQSGVPASYLKDMAELIRLNQAGVIVGKEYNDALKKQQDILLQKTGVTKGAAAAANQEQNTYETLVASIRTKIAANEAEISGAGRLTESDKLRIKLMEELKVGSKTLTAEHKERALALLDILSAQEKEEARIKSLVVAYKQEAEVAEEIAQAYVTQTKAREAGRAVVDSYVNGIDESNKALQYELSLMGLGTSAREVALEQYRIELDLKKQIAAIDANTGFDAAQREEERARARAGAAIAKANAASKAFLDEWKTSVSKYDDIFRQGFADMLNNGKDGWKSFTKSLVTTFKTTVADQIYKMFAQPFVVKLVGSLLGFTGASGVANASTGGASMLGNVGSLLGAGSSAFGIGASYGATSLFANGLGSTLSAGSSMIGAGSVMSGLGTIAGALGPIALGIGAIYTIAKSIDDSGTYHTGGAAQYSAATGLRTSLGFRDNEEGLPSYNPNDNIDNQFGTGFGYVERGDQTISAVSTMAQALGTALDGVAVSFGQKAGYEIATAFADDTSKDGAWGALRISKDGQELLNWENTRQSRWAPREFGDGEEGYKQYLAAVAKDTRQVLLDMDLPSWADTMLESIGDAANMDQLAATVQQIGAIQTTFTNLGKAIEGFAGMSDKTFEALMKASGGLEALSANAGSYYENFYSDAEKTASVTRSVSDALAAVGLAMPATRDEFRALVESQLALGEEGAKASATLLGVSGAFASVVPAAEEASTAIGDVLSEAMKRLQSDTAGLQIELLRAQGNTTGADTAQRALDTKDFTAAEIALYDYNKALRDQITVANAATQAAEQQAETRAGLERQILELQGDTAALRELDIAGMDAANVALYDRVQAFTAEQTAAQEATQALEQQASIRAGLERQLLEAQGDTAAIRDLERASLDESNRAIYDRINALADEQAATQAATQAAQAIAAERASLQQQFDQLTMSSTELLAQQRASLDESNHALFDRINALADEQAAAQAAAQAMDQVAQSIKSLSAQSASLKVELLRAQGNTAVANAAQYLIDTTGMTEAEKAIFDYNASLKAQIAALNDAAAAAQTAAEAAARAREQAAQAAERILSERTGLEGQLLTLQGNTAELRRRELATLDDSNRALQLQIWALEDQKTAAEQATQAAESLASAWASISDSLMDEVKRIRGLMNDGAGQSLAALQSQFAIATAQARAGDQDAANSLTGLSRSLLESAAGQAATLADLQRLQAMTANSLEATAGMVGGTSASGGGVIVRAADNQGLMSRLTGPQDNSAALISEIRALREEVKGLRAEAQATAGHTSKTARLLDRVMPDGDALSIRTAL